MGDCGACIRPTEDGTQRSGEQGAAKQPPTLKASSTNTPGRAHRQADRAAALLDRLHRVLDLEEAPLRGPGRHVGVVLLLLLVMAALWFVWVGCGLGQFRWAAPGDLLHARAHRMQTQQAQRSAQQRAAPLSRRQW